MKRYSPRYKICLQNKKNKNSNFNSLKLNKKKWKNFIRIIKRHLLSKFKFKKKLKTKRFKKKLLNLKKKKRKLRIVRKKKDLYKLRLHSIQQFKFFYGCISEYELKKIFKKSIKKANFLNKNFQLEYFLSIMESRLDILLFRAGLVHSIFEAKQLINHKQIKINNKIITSPSFLLNEGDIFEVINNKKIRRLIIE